MDQLQIIKGSNKQLTHSFLINDKHHLLLQSLIQNSQVFLLISSFLTVPEVLAFAQSSKSFSEVVKTNVHVQNRILHCQVEYLTKQEEKNTRFSIFAPNIYGGFAYSLFDAYFYNQTKMGNIGEPNINKILSTVPIYRLGSSMGQRRSIIQRGKNKTNTPKQAQISKNKTLEIESSMKDKLAIKSISIQKQEQLLKHRLMEDPEYKLLSKWSEMSKQRQQKVSQVFQKLHKQNKGFVFNNVFKDAQTPEPNPSLSSAIWEKIKSLGL